MLQHESRPVVVEISYTFASWAVRDCPGHWVLQGNSLTGKLEWIDGQMGPEDAIFADFVTAIDSGTKLLDSQAAISPAVL